MGEISRAFLKWFQKSRKNDSFINFEINSTRNDTRILQNNRPILPTAENFQKIPEPITRKN